jgi:predicted O-methyltransferase YrrM
MNRLHEALLAALQETEYLRHKDWKEMEMLKRHVYESEHFYLSIREADIYASLGKHLSQNDNETCVLDVGCGTGMTASKLLTNLSNATIYTSIDVKTFPEKVAQMNPKNHTHIIRDIFDPDPVISNDPNTGEPIKYDIVFIDIEPHGKEIDVYEKICHLMKPSHLCILKHVAFIDLFRCMFADSFIDCYKDNIYDFFAEENGRPSHCNVRDVFVLFSTSIGHYQDNRCQNLAQGNVVVYPMSKLKVQGYCKVNR